MTRRNAAIIGVGSYLPERVLSNADLERMVETNDEWIVSRTGIRERRMGDESMATSDLAARAAERAIRSAGLSPSDIDLLVVGTSSPDHALFPSTACLVQAKLGLGCAAFDVNAACTGFVYALQVGASAIESLRAETVLVIGADMLTRHVDFKDRSTCILFGDGAGAVVLRAAVEPGVESIVLGSDGTGADLLKVPAGGTAAPCTVERINERQQYVQMQGNDVFKFAVRVIPKATVQALTASGHSVEDLAWLIPHQANQRILNTVEERLGIDHDRVFSNVEKVGNTSAASIPLALDDLYTSGRLQPGDLVALVGFGAGLTWGAAVVRWTMTGPEQGGLPE
ncbi:MAG: ketoacyl-ACP synthase III [Coriobacteriales bacterium]|nr:ketoacyl-ACP synthase III [Coriobacteriales bacterium]